MTLNASCLIDNLTIWLIFDYKCLKNNYLTVCVPAKNISHFFIINPSYTIKMNLDYIDDLVDVDMCYLYYKGKAILSANTMVKLKKEVKENIEEPAEDKEVYFISFGKSTNKEKLLFVHCGECVIRYFENYQSRQRSIGANGNFEINNISEVLEAAGGGGRLLIDDDGSSAGEEIELSVNKRKKVKVRKSKTLAEENIDYFLSIMEVGKRNGMTNKTFYEQIVDVNLDFVMIAQVMDKLNKKLDTKVLIQDEDSLKLKKQQSMYDDIAELEGRVDGEVMTSWPKVRSYYTQSLFNTHSTTALDGAIEDLEFMLKVAKFQKKIGLENRAAMETLRNFIRTYQVIQLGYQTDLPELA